MSSQHASLPVPAAGVMLQALDDGAVLFSPSTELYFGLNHVGARVWELLGPGLLLDDLCARLHQHYPDADRPTLSRDVAALLDRLAAEGLVVTVAGQG